MVESATAVASVVVDSVAAVSVVVPMDAIVAAPTPTAVPLDAMVAGAAVAHVDVEYLVNDDQKAALEDDVFRLGRAPMQTLPDMDFHQDDKDPHQDDEGGDESDDESDNDFPSLDPAKALALPSTPRASSFLVSSPSTPSSPSPLATIEAREPEVQVIPAPRTAAQLACFISTRVARTRVWGVCDREQVVSPSSASVALVVDSNCGKFGGNRTRMSGPPSAPPGAAGASSRRAARTAARAIPRSSPWALRSPHSLSTTARFRRARQSRPRAAVSGTNSQTGSAAAGAAMATDDDVFLQDGGKDEAGSNMATDANQAATDRVRARGSKNVVSPDDDSKHADAPNEAGRHTTPTGHSGQATGATGISVTAGRDANGVSVPVAVATMQGAQANSISIGAVNVGGPQWPLPPAKQGRMITAAEQRRDALAQGAPPSTSAAPRMQFASTNFANDFKPSAADERMFAARDESAKR